MICRDCEKESAPKTHEASRFGRCDVCQQERDEYYDDKMREELTQKNIEECEEWDSQ